MKKITIALSALVTLIAAGNAQDTRTVIEPRIPPVCAKIEARLTGPIRAQDEDRLDTVRLQKAIDTCEQGKAVELVSHSASNAFMTGPLELKPGITLLVDKGVTLYGSRNPADYETSPGSCGVVDDKRNGCKPLIFGRDAANAAVMGDGVIDGRGGEKMLGAGKPSEKSWWDLAEDARKGGHQEVPRLIQMDSCDNFTLYRITLKNAAFFHVTYNHGNGFTVWGLKIDTPKNARNTDGVDPGSGSKNITITHSFIRAGDDNVAIKGGGSAPTTNITVAHNHFYYGHGMSIGSETDAGVSGLLVTDLSLDGTDNGIRIKSQEAYGGLVRDAVYDDVCVRNSRYPIILDTNYTANPKPGKGLIPVYRDIVLRNVRISGGGVIRLNGFDATHRMGVQFDGVTALDPPSSYRYDIRHADIQLGPGPVNLQLAGEDIKVSGTPASGVLQGCANKFVPFPSE